MIRLKRLRLQNFRCFRECEVEFDEKLTVFVSPNGQGKTALLDGIAISLGLFIDALSNKKQSRGFALRDVHRVQSEAGRMVRTGFVKFEADAEISNSDVRWMQQRKSGSKLTRTSKKDASPIIEAAETLRSRVDSDSHNRSSQQDLPLIAYFATDRRGRIDGLYGQRATSLGLKGRLSGYADCLHASAGFKFFSEWYEATFRTASDMPVTGKTDAARPELLLAAVNAAVNAVLEGEAGWSGLSWNTEEGELTLTHPVYGELPLSFLSDGVRNTAALAADVAHRCVRLNPHLKSAAAKSTPGILVVDEVDLHLHPEWQQKILRMLGTAFPEMQLIVSTHSPQVLSTVDVKSIRTVNIDDYDSPVSTPKFQTRGSESTDALLQIMQVAAMPDVPEAAWLNDYRVMIEEGREDTAVAKVLRERLVKHFGLEHPQILDCDRLIRFTKFKKTQSGRG